MFFYGDFALPNKCSFMLSLEDYVDAAFVVVLV